MEVYIELVYVINLAILIICFQMMTILLNIQLSYKKTILYSILINYSIVMLYVDNIYYILLIGWFLTFLYLFKKQVFLYYPVFVFIYYSLIYFIRSLITESFIYQGILITPISFTNMTLGVVAIVFLILQTMFIVYSRRKINTDTYMFDVTIIYQQQTYQYQGFLDSGNEVYYQGYPLLLINKNKITDYDIIETVLVDNVQDIEVDVIQVEKCIVNHQELKNVYVGLIENIKYDCLLHKQLMGGVM
ncbi:MAG: hypothetical protein ACK5LC_07485 [Coprobacillaceae bacterium]